MINRVEQLRRDIETADILIKETEELLDPSLNRTEEELKLGNAIVAKLKEQNKERKAQLRRYGG